MNVSDIIYCAVLIAAIYTTISILLHEKGAGISPTPSLPAVRKDVLDLIARYSSPDVDLRIGELGCGWGGLAIALARRFPTARIVGYEVSPCPLFISRLRAMLRPRITIRNDDFFEDGWDQFDVLVCYLSPKHMIRIKQKLEGMEKRPLLISCSFELPDTVPTEVRTRMAVVKIPIFAYRWQ